MPVDVPEMLRKQSEHYKQMKRRLDAKKEREEEQRKKEREESKKRSKEWDAHSEEYKTIQGLRLVKQTSGGSLDSGMVNLFFGIAFDKIRDLGVEIKELKTQLGFAKEIKKDIKALEIKINHKEIDTLIENLEETLG